MDDVRARWLRAHEIEAALFFAAYGGMTVDEAAADRVDRGGLVQLVREGKERGMAVFLVGQVTKEGTVAGPKTASAHRRAPFLVVRDESRGSPR